MSIHITPLAIDIKLWSRDMNFDGQIMKKRALKHYDELALQCLLSKEIQRVLAFMNTRGI